MKKLFCYLGLPHILDPDCSKCREREKCKELEKLEDDAILYNMLGEIKKQEQQGEVKQ